MSMPIIYQAMLPGEWTELSVSAGHSTLPRSGGVRTYMLKQLPDGSSLPISVCLARPLKVPFPQELGRAHLVKLEGLKSLIARLPRQAWAEGQRTLSSPTVAAYVVEGVYDLNEGDSSPFDEELVSRWLKQIYPDVEPASPGDLEAFIANLPSDDIQPLRVRRADYWIVTPGSFEALLASFSTPILNQPELFYQLLDGIVLAISDLDDDLDDEE
jgi:hypothetical protein